MYKFVCDEALSDAVLKLRYERHEALVIEIRDAIRAAIVKNNRTEVSLGCTHSTPVEVNTALADAVLKILDARGDVENFITELRIMATPDRLEYF